MIGLSKPDVQALKSLGDIEGLVKALSYPSDTAVRQAAAEALKKVGDYRILETIEGIKENVEEEWFRLQRLAESNDAEDSLSVYMEDDSPGHAGWRQDIESRVRMRKEIEAKEDIALLASEVMEVLSSQMPDCLQSEDPTEAKILRLVVEGRRMDAIRAACTEANLSLAESRAYVETVLPSAVNQLVAQGKRNEAINLLHHATGMSHREAVEYIDRE